jgi:phage shock protein PspC (stress-responsive transcriptional regulator)
MKKRTKELLGASILSLLFISAWVLGVPFEGIVIYLLCLNYMDEKND